MDYYFTGPGDLSQQVLQNYLAKSVTMQMMCHIDEGNTFYPLMTAAERTANLDMILDAGVKFAGRTSYSKYA